MSISEVIKQQCNSTTCCTQGNCCSTFCNTRII